MELKELKEKFISLYGGDERGIRVFFAPGRVNLIGEHIDYNGGLVLPAALTLGTTLLARPTGNDTIRLAATDIEGIVTADISKLESYKKIPWGSYQLGTAYELMKAGYNISGCDLLYHDTVPHGSGLSSSAAIEVATAVALYSLSNTAPADMVKMALIGQSAENNYVGVSCGIMDQFASAMGRENHAIMLNCMDLGFEHVPFNISGYKLIISNTNKKRSLADSKYNERRAECEAALGVLKARLPHINYLCDVTPREFEEYKGFIEDETVRRRAEHVICENARVIESAKALREGNLSKFGEYMVASHNSLRDLYEVTGKELDTLVEEALKIDGVLGARMTGAGFGGCSISLVPEEIANEFIVRVGEKYKEKIGYAATFYTADIGDGGREITP